MNKRVQKFKDRLKNKEKIVFNGAMGTEISSRGIKTTLPLWSASVLLENPEVVKQIHLDYINSGAEIIVTNTFRTQRRTFEKVGIGDKSRDATILAVKLADDARNESGKEDVLIAGSVTTLEDCYRPDLIPSDKELEEEHLEHAQNLRDGGVDYLLIETVNTIKETLAAVRAAKKAELPFAVTFVGNEKGQLLSGEDLGKAIKEVEKYNPLYIGLNCMTIDSIAKSLPFHINTVSVPISLAAQGDGVPDDIEGWRFEGKNPEDQYLNQAKNWAKNGVQIIGGCCGTNPNYIKRIASEIIASTPLSYSIKVKP